MLGLVIKKQTKHDGILTKMKNPQIFWGFFVGRVSVFYLMMLMPFLFGVGFWAVF